MGYGSEVASFSNIKFFQNATDAVGFFGEQLRRAGYNYHGHERLYSGITGEEFEADIFMGVVYYQRLRHMVSDKYQVRTTGPVHTLTHQPIKGRKRAGGIRFGEMERDSLLSHGASFLLQDRLFRCSDAAEVRWWRAAECFFALSPFAQVLEQRHSQNKVLIVLGRGRELKSKRASERDKG